MPLETGRSEAKKNKKLKLAVLRQLLGLRNYTVHIMKPEEYICITKYL